MVPYLITEEASIRGLVRSLGDWRGHAACRPRNILESQTRAAQAWYYFTPTTSFHSGGDSARMESKDINGMDFSHQKQRRKQHICKGVYKHNDICTFFCSWFRSFWAFPKQWCLYSNGFRDLQFDIHEPTTKPSWGMKPCRGCKVVKKRARNPTWNQNRQMSHHFEDKSPCLEYQQFSPTFFRSNLRVMNDDDWHDSTPRVAAEGLVHSWVVHFWVLLVDDLSTWVRVRWVKHRGEVKHLPPEKKYMVSENKAIEGMI